MITDVRNPKWTTPQKNQIIVEIKSSLYPDDGWIPYVAGPSELNKDEATIYGLVVNGAFGKVEDSDNERIIRGELPLPEGIEIIDGKLVDTAYLEHQATEELNRRLSEWQTPESLALAETDEEYSALRKASMKTLLAVKNQSGWPVNVVWPD